MSKAKVKPTFRVIDFAGPNGACKSTHADAILEKLSFVTFVNSDFIARGLSGRNTDAIEFEAGPIMLKRLQQLAGSKSDFAFEFTFSSRTFALFLRGNRGQTPINSVLLKESLVCSEIFNLVGNNTKT